MASFEVVLRDQSVARVDGADAYQQEGQLTTFFATDRGRPVVDSWSTRLASFRTAEVLVVRRTDAVATVAGTASSAAPVVDLARARTG